MVVDELLRMVLMKVSCYPDSHVRKWLDLGIESKMVARLVLNHLDRRLGLTLDTIRLATR